LGQGHKLCLHCSSKTKNVFIHFNLELLLESKLYFRNVNLTFLITEAYHCNGSFILKEHIFVVLDLDLTCSLVIAAASFERHSAGLYIILNKLDWWLVYNQPLLVFQYTLIVHVNE